MSAQSALIMAVVVLTALLAGFGATYVEQHARVMDSEPVRMASNTES